MPEFSLHRNPHKLYGDSCLLLNWSIVKCPFRAGRTPKDSSAYQWPSCKHWKAAIRSSQCLLFPRLSKPLFTGQTLQLVVILLSPEGPEFCSWLCPGCRPNPCKITYFPQLSRTVLSAVGVGDCIEFWEGFFQTINNHKWIPIILTWQRFWSWKIRAALKRGDITKEKVMNKAAVATVHLSMKFLGCTQPLALSN